MRRNSSPDEAFMQKSFTVQEVAKHLAIGEDEVRRHIKSGELKAFNVGKGMLKPRWRIDPEWLEQFKARRMNFVPPPTRRRQRKPEPMPQPGPIDPVLGAKLVKEGKAVLLGGEYYHLYNGYALIV